MIGRTTTEGMAQPVFFESAPSATPAEHDALMKLFLANTSRAMLEMTELVSLRKAGPVDPAFFDNLKYADRLASNGEERE